MITLPYFLLPFPSSNTPISYRLFRCAHDAEHPARLLEIARRQVVECWTSEVVLHAPLALVETKTRSLWLFAVGEQPENSLMLEKSPFNGFEGATSICLVTSLYRQLVLKGITPPFLKKLNRDLTPFLICTLAQNSVQDWSGLVKIVRLPGT